MIWQKQNEICFQKKFKSEIILPQDKSNSDIGGCGNGGGHGGGGAFVCGDGVVVVMVFWW